MKKPEKSPMKIISNPPKKSWSELLSRPQENLQEIEASVRQIAETVREKGDEALRDFTQKFDGVSIDKLQVKSREFEEAELVLDDNLKIALQVAMANIRKFHEAQIDAPKTVETMPGVKCMRRSLPIDRVGLYVPGGSAPLFSTVLMLAVPAAVVGCPQRILCTPPGRDGKIHPAILYAAKISGIKKVYKVGGAQAVAAMAFGTKTIPATDKIFGPGNRYVTAAKQYVNLLGTAIDMPAGPSEVAVYADSSADPVFVAADLLSQAEHGPDSQVILISKSRKILEKTALETERFLKKLPRQEIARKALKNSKFILVKKKKTAVEMLNKYAAEHLILAMRKPEKFAEKITNAGSVFLGHYSPEAVGDYASGTNHTLPTNGYARVTGGVSADSFVKKVTYQEISPAGLLNLGKVVEIMAEAEELHAHKLAVSVRLKKLAKRK